MSWKFTDESFVKYLQNTDPYVDQVNSDQDIYFHLFDVPKILQLLLLELDALFSISIALCTALSLLLVRMVQVQLLLQYNDLYQSSITIA